MSDLTDTELTDEAVNGLGCLLVIMVLVGLLCFGIIQGQIGNIHDRIVVLETQQEQK